MNPYYSGPPSDHFDGLRFFNPDGVDTDRIMFDDLAAFAAHIRRNDPVTRHTLFDLAVVVTTATTPDEAAALAKRMRQIGLKRFVMGSDYDLSTPKSSDHLTRAKLPLSNREWRVIARNCAPWAC